MLGEVKCILGFGEGGGGTSPDFLIATALAMSINPNRLYSPSLTESGDAMKINILSIYSKSTHSKLYTFYRGEFK